MLMLFTILHCQFNHILLTPVMKKIVFFLFAVFILGNNTLIKAQCYGVVHYDQSATANGLSTFTINTANANELILIAYNGWPGPGSGPVTVDGNPATHINTAHTSNDACAEVYCYSAPAAGAHNIKLCFRILCNGKLYAIEL